VEDWKFTNFDEEHLGGRIKHFPQRVTCAEESKLTFMAYKSKVHQELTNALVNLTSFPLFLIYLVFVSYILYKTHFAQFKKQHAEANAHMMPYKFIPYLQLMFNTN
jgi:hypothetical protein